MSVLKVSDAFCYICRGVLIEPVTVPCGHVFCYTCFEQSMQETSYCCPLCRRRISNWVRTAKKSGTLKNAELWKEIKKQFKEQVRLKMNGQDDGLDESLGLECPTPLTISNPGEVAKEFSKLIHDYQAEQMKLQASEESASRDLIYKLKEEERREIEAIRQQNLLKTQKDEALARKLQDEINKEVPTSSHNQVSNHQDKTRHHSGPMDNYLKVNVDNKKKGSVRLQSHEKLGNRSTSSDSTDSIQSEMHHFKPIKVVPRTPPKRYPDGKVLEISLTKVKPLKLLNSPQGVNTYGTTNNFVECKKIHSPYSAFIGKILPCHDSSNESPRKRVRQSADEQGNGVLKEITLGENSDSNSMGPMDADGKGQGDAIRKKLNSPFIITKSSHVLKKPVNGGYVLPPKLFHFDSVASNPEEESENSDFPPQFEGRAESEVEMDAELIEEQKRIEEMISQEKADRELALKLSQEWEERYELRRKPKEKQIVIKRKRNARENKKCQQTLITSLVRAKNRGK